MEIPNSFRPDVIRKSVTPTKLLCVLGLATTLMVSACGIGDDSYVSNWRKGAENLLSDPTKLHTYITVAAGYDLKQALEMQNNPKTRINVRAGEYRSTYKPDGSENPIIGTLPLGAKIRGYVDENGIAPYSKEKAAWIVSDFSTNTAMDWNITINSPVRRSGDKVIGTVLGIYTKQID